MGPVKKRSGSTKVDRRVHKRGSPGRIDLPIGPRERIDQKRLRGTHGPEQGSPQKLNKRGGSGGREGKKG